MGSGTSTMVGKDAPELSLEDTEGERHELAAADSKATVVIWTCNHCPYARAWHDRLADVARDYVDRGVKFLAANSNDPDRYPGDSLEAMRERAEAEEWPFPYLHDPTQEAARAWNAQTTPHIYLIDASGTIAYEGAPDVDYQDPPLEAAWLREALDAVLDGREPARDATDPVGCSIKWKV
jgi:peroxiredoxin